MQFIINFSEFIKCHSIHIYLSSKIRNDKCVSVIYIAFTFSGNMQNNILANIRFIFKEYLIFFWSSSLVTGVFIVKEYLIFLSAR